MGHVQGIKTLPVLQKARSEAMALNDLNKNNFTDLRMHYLNQNPTAKYIQHIQSTFGFYIFSKTQLKVACENVPIEPFILHLDSTGSTVNKPNDEKCTCPDKRSIKDLITIHI